jgi:hypothetical protein
MRLLCPDPDGSKAFCNAMAPRAETHSSCLWSKEQFFIITMMVLDLNLKFSVMKFFDFEMALI